MRIGCGPRTRHTNFNISVKGGLIARLRIVPEARRKGQPPPLASLPPGWYNGGVWTNKTGPRLLWVVGSLGLALGGLALLGALGGALGAFRDNAAFWLPYPYPRPGSEGLMLYETLLMRGGTSLYGPITPDRFISGPYPPIDYLLTGWLLPPGAARFTEGRTLSRWAALTVAAALVVLVGMGARDFRFWILNFGTSVTDKNVSASNTQSLIPGLNPKSKIQNLKSKILIVALAGLIGAGLWLIQPPVLIWATRFRADMLMMAFTALGLLAVAAGTVRRHPRLPLHALTWLAIPLFVLAIFTKQTALWGPLAAGLFLLLRGPRAAIIWGLVLLLAVAIPFALLDTTTDHGFYLKMVVYHRLPYSLPTLRRLVDAFLEDHALLFVVAAGYAGWRLLTRRPDLATCALLAALAVLPTAGVVGADSNHLLFLGFACAWCAAAAILDCGFRILDHGRGVSEDAAPKSVPKSKIQNLKSLTPILVALLALLLLGGYVSQVSTPAGWYGEDLRHPTAAEQEQRRKIIANVRDTPGAEFFADDPGILALAGKATAFDDPFTMTALAPDGGWDQSAFVQRLREGRFPLVILAGDAFDPTHPLRADILTPQMLDALKAGYTLLFRDVYFTYAPRPKS